MKEPVLKHPEQIAHLLGIVEIVSKFAPSPINTISEVFFGQIRDVLSGIEVQRINKATERVLLGLDRDINVGKKLNPKIVNLNQTDHRQRINQELLEQIIRKCKDEPEEKKQVFISNIYRNILTVNWKSSEKDNFHNPEWGHTLAQIVQNMTYQQLLILKQVKSLNQLITSGWKSLISEPGKTPAVYVKKEIYEYEDYIRLFNEPFGIKRYSTTPNLVETLILSDYDQLKRLRLIEDDLLLINHLKKRNINHYIPHLDSSFCYLAKLSHGFGFYASILLFHEDDSTEIPSLEQDMKNLESIIIDHQVAEELKEKYRTIEICRNQS